MTRHLALLLLLVLPARGQVDAKFIQETVSTLAATIDHEYMDPAMATRIAASLRANLAAGSYSSTPSIESLATLLTRDLLSLSHDKHLAINLIPGAFPSPAPQQESREARARRTNFGIQKVEILPGNIGYLNITAFERAYLARDAISAAMSLLRYAEALIVDLRSNGGGAPDSAALFLSYFFDQPGLPLFDVVPRSGETPTAYQTESKPLPERNGTRPVYLLTSAKTFSAGEGVAFLLQERHRVEVIGETTAGAANPGKAYPINSRLEVIVPNGRVRSAISGKNWEGTGVVPDVQTTADQALDAALSRAAKQAPAASMHR